MPKRHRRNLPKTSSISSSAFENLSTFNPRPTRRHRYETRTSSSYDNQRNINLASLPQGVLDRIIRFLFHPEYTEAVKRIPRCILSLALTCKSMYACVTRHIARIFMITSRRVSSTAKLLKIPTDFESDISYRNLLIGATLIALNKLKPEATFSDTRQSINEGVLTRRMRQAIYGKDNNKTEVKFLFYRNLVRYFDKRDKCNSSFPLFYEDAHNTICRERLCWLAIAASSGCLTSIDFDAVYEYCREPNYRKEILCMLRFLHLLKLPLNCITLTEDYKRCPLKGEVFFQHLLQNAADSLQYLIVNISPLTKEAIQLVSLPNLCEVHFHHYEKNIEYHRKSLLDVLVALHRNGARIKRLMLDHELMSSIATEDHAVLANCLSDLEDLRCDESILAGFQSTEDEEGLISGVVPGPFHMIDTLRIWVYGACTLSMATLDRYCTSMLPNLKNLTLHVSKIPDFRSSQLHTEGIEQNTVTRSNQTLNICELVRAYHGPFGRNNAQWENLRKNITSTVELLELSVRCDQLDELRSFLESTRRLTSLWVNIYGSFTTSFSSRRLVESIISISKRDNALTNLVVQGCSASVDQCQEILKAMGSNTEEFSFRLGQGLEGIEAEDDILLPNYEQVLRILDTVEEYCPNIETLCFITDTNVCDWEQNHINVVENYVFRVASSLKNFQLASFFEQWPPLDSSCMPYVLS